MERGDNLWALLVLALLTACIVVVAMGAPLSVLLIALVACCVHTLRISAMSVTTVVGLPEEVATSTELEQSPPERAANDAVLPYELIDHAFYDSLNNADAIAEHIKSATELGVLNASEGASEITAHLGNRQHQMSRLSNLLGESAAQPDEVGNLRAFVGKHQSLCEKFARAIAQLEEQSHSLSESKAIFDDLREQEGHMRALLCDVQSLASQADQALTDFFGELKEDEELFRQNANRILMELQFQDKIRQELERLQHQSRLPLAVLRELASEIREGLVDQQDYEQRTAELFETLYQETKGSTTHDFCDTDGGATSGEFEMF